MGMMWCSIAKIIGVHLVVTTSTVSPHNPAREILLAVSLYHSSTKQKFHIGS
jgi:hypothetical protein